MPQVCFIYTFTYTFRVRKGDFLAAPFRRLRRSK